MVNHKRKRLTIPFNHEHFRDVSPEPQITSQDLKKKKVIPCIIVPTFLSGIITYIFHVIANDEI